MQCRYGNQSVANVLCPRSIPYIYKSNESKLEHFPFGGIRLWLSGERLHWQQVGMKINDSVGTLITASPSTVGHSTPSLSARWGVTGPGGSVAARGAGQQRGWGVG